MALLPFVAYTLVGATLWNSILLYAGYKMQEHWNMILKYRRPIDHAVILILVGFAVYFFVTHILPQWRNRKGTGSPG